MNRTSSNTLSIPSSAHPLVREFYRLCIRDDVKMHELADRAGLSLKTIAAWRQGICPSVGNIEACFNALGYRLEVVRDEPAARQAA